MPDGLTIPLITLHDSTKLLFSLKTKVSDAYSLTHKHFINAGIAGQEHFCALLNILISGVNLCTLEALNKYLHQFYISHMGNQKIMHTPMPSSRSWS